MLQNYVEISAENVSDFIPFVQKTVKAMIAESNGDMSELNEFLDALMTLSANLESLCNDVPQKVDEYTQRLNKIKALREDVARKNAALADEATRLHEEFGIEAYEPVRENDKNAVEELEAVDLGDLIDINIIPDQIGALVFEDDDEDEDEEEPGNGEDGNAESFFKAIGSYDNIATVPIDMDSGYRPIDKEDFVNTSPDGIMSDDYDDLYSSQEDEENNDEFDDNFSDDIFDDFMEDEKYNGDDNELEQNPYTVPEFDDDYPNNANNSEAEAKIDEVLDSMGDSLFDEEDIDDGDDNVFDVHSTAENKNERKSRTSDAIQREDAIFDDFKFD